MEVDFANVRQVEGILDALAPLKKRIEDMVNLANPPECAKRCLLSNNKIMRLCLLAGLAQSDKRSTGDLDGVSVSKNSSRIFDSFFTVASMGEVFSTILKMRYEGSGGGISATSPRCLVQSGRRCCVESRCWKNPARWKTGSRSRRAAEESARRSRLSD